eukprot:gene10632-biopygen12338
MPRARAAQRRAAAVSPPPPGTRLDMHCDACEAAGVGQEIRWNCAVLCGEDGFRRPLHWWRYSCESYKKLA